MKLRKLTAILAAMILESSLRFRGRCRGGSYAGDLHLAREHRHHHRERVQAL